MKNLIFKIKWLIKFRLSLRNIKEKHIAIVVDKFVDDAAGREALRLYNLYLSKDYMPYILCAFNNAPMGRYIKDIRHIYIFNNNPEIFVQFCQRKKINILHYIDKDLMLNAAHQFGFKIVFSLCDFRDPNLAQRLSVADRTVFATAQLADEYRAMGFCEDGIILTEDTDYTENL